MNVLYFCLLLYFLLFVKVDLSGSSGSGGRLLCCKKSLVFLEKLLGSFLLILSDALKRVTNLIELTLTALPGFLAELLKALLCRHHNSGGRH